MYRLAGRLLRIVLCILLLGSMLAQVLVRVAASQEAVIHPEVAYLEVPYSVAAILWIACGQAALVAAWGLLSRVDRGVLLAPRTVRWVDVVTASAAAAAILAAAVLAHLLLVVGAGGPVFYYLGACVVVCVAVVLATVVIRGVILAEAGAVARTDRS